MMNHQKHIATTIAHILALPEDVVQSFCLGNPFDKLLRSYDEFTSDGLGLYGQRAYRSALGRRHYKFSREAYAAALSRSDKQKLVGEHRIPLKLIIQKLLNSNRSLSSIEQILRANEVVIITKKEQQNLDGNVKTGGCGLKSLMPANGGCRLAHAGIEIAPETLSNHL